MRLFLVSFLVLILILPSFAKIHQYRFDEVIDQESINIARNDIEKISFKPGDFLEVWINSPGGSVTASINFYDYLLSLKSKQILILTVGSGICASGATILLQAGDVRIVTKHSLFLVHRATIEKEWYVRWIPDPTLDYVNEVMYGLYADRTGKSVEFLRKDLSWDHWMTAEEACQHGYADFIIK